ncbi:MAG: transposase [Pseudomonadota bacterium]
MTRPARILLADGWYHVANRGAGRQRVFRNDQHRGLFLELLQDLQSAFAVAVHAYCLMSNRYDLIVHNREANLSEAMRHLNGVYTQRHNRDVGRDGPLFRGRYRAVLFDPELALLAVSRHLHRRPLATGRVPTLTRYRWSSYPSYVTRRRRPDWLHREAVLAAAAGSAARYRAYVEREGEPNEVVRRFYRQSRPGPVLGGPELLARIAGQGDAELTAPDAISYRRVLRLVADHFEVPRRSLLSGTQGRLNEPRLAAIWLCRRHCRLTLKELAAVFRVAGFGTISAALNRMPKRMGPRFWKQVAALEAQLAPQP